MIGAALYRVAGIDRKTLATCPGTDKIWAAQLGFSLLLSFIVVLGITFHASGYVIDNVWTRLLASTVVALTVFMFDRALYQSDWFYHGVLGPYPEPARDGERPGGWRALRRFFRITIRLSISLGLAWVIAVFLELAIFSDTIEDRIKRDQLAANQAILQKIEQFEIRLGSQAAERRKELGQLEALYRAELTTASPTESEQDRGQIAALGEQIAALDAQEQTLRKELREAQANSARHAEEMHAEQLGQRINPRSSGMAGAGPRYTFALRQKELYETRVKELESELAQLHSRRDDLRDRQRRLMEQTTARLDQNRSAAQGRRDAIYNQMEAARAELAELEASQAARIEDFRKKSLSAPDYHKQKNDPLSRMTAYQELKNDPKEGQTITLFSWMTKFLVIFLEVAPVVAKMFFSPRSVYAIRIQAIVETEQLRAMRERERAILDQQAAREADSRAVESPNSSDRPGASPTPSVEAPATAPVSSAAPQLAKSAPVERTADTGRIAFAGDSGQTAMPGPSAAPDPGESNPEVASPAPSREAPMRERIVATSERANPAVAGAPRQEDVPPPARPGAIDPQLQYDMDDTIEFPDEIPRREEAASVTAEPERQEAILHFPGKKSAKAAT